MSSQHAVWACPHIEQTLRLARNVARTEATILIRGETGTGKEIIAREIHRASGRTGPLIAVNCGAIPEHLIEAELFGYEKGAFTGASQQGSIGKFAAAEKGTLFLDEIGDMQPRLQVALLRALEEKRVTPVGSHRAQRVDVRIIAATNRNLLADIHRSRFRPDLYYRLSEIELTLPPLRSRTDLIPLAEHFLHKVALELNVSAFTLAETALCKIQRHSWPGNIRELRHVLRQAAYRAYFMRQSATIVAEDVRIPEAVHTSIPPPSDEQSDEEKRIARAMKEAGGNMSKAARLLGIGRTTLYRKVHRYPRLEQLKDHLRKRAPAPDMKALFD